LGLDPYPEDQKVTALLATVREELKALPYGHRRIDVTIYVSKSAEQAVVALENRRTIFRNHANPQCTSLKGVSLYGYSVHVSPDDLMDGKDARVVYTPE
jgi:hypothetical protein